MATYGSCLGSMQSTKENLLLLPAQSMCLDREWAAGSENWGLGAHAEKKQARSEEGVDAKKGDK